MAAMSKSKTVSKNKGKTSHVKIANKNLKKKKKLKIKKKKTKESHPENIPEENETEEIPLQEEDFEYFGSEQGNLPFVNRIKQNFGAQRKRKAEIEEEKSYEKAPRMNFHEEESKVYKPLLPVKIKNKLIPQVKEIETNKNSESEEEDDDKHESPSASATEEEENCSTAEQIFKLKEQLSGIKNKMALIALAVIENPTEKICGLRQLRLLLQETDGGLKVMVRKLGMVTSMEVFKDIIPSYKIRVLSSKELQQKTSKETKDLQNYEEYLLVSYKHYLEYLSSVVRGTIWKSDDSSISKADQKVLKEVAIQCLCELLVSCHHFNFRSELISNVVYSMNLFNKKGSEAACEAVKQVFKSDKLGATTCEIVKAIENLIKNKKMKVNPKVLKTFLSLKIEEIQVDRVTTKVEKEKRKQRLIKMSRQERKREKQMEKLNRELLETKASEDKMKKCELNTQIVQHVFATYIRILKKNPDSDLLSCVLEGLAKFVHLVNIDYFDDLFGVLNKLISSSELTVQQSFHCALTALIMLSDQGSVLNIDPVRFYKHVYANLIQLHAGSTNVDINIVLECLEALIFKRKKQLTKSSTHAFMKRLATVSLHTLSETSLAFLAVLRSMIHSFPSSEMMFDNDYKCGNGLFLPEIDDPEYCNASNTSLWELHLLKKHVCPKVRLFANHVAHQAPLTGTGQLPSDMAKLTATELYESYLNKNEFSFVNK